MFAAAQVASGDRAFGWKVRATTCNLPYSLGHSMTAFTAGGSGLVNDVRDRILDLLNHRHEAHQGRVRCRDSLSGQLVQRSGPGHVSTPVSRAAGNTSKVRSIPLRRRHPHSQAGPVFAVG